jgi:prepilin-type N-terminal cleavage/methylation domain-containing protein/prepilin-type processing-associated H-X9-DG protein
MLRRKGFTLIELLVVIAIIAILAAMLFPVFARARESARKIQCLSNVKNIAIAVQMYLTDYDRFPPSEHRPDAISKIEEWIGQDRGCDCHAAYRATWSNPFVRWPVVLDEYVRNRDVWSCPSAKFDFSSWWIIPQYMGDWLKYLEATHGQWVAHGYSTGGDMCAAHGMPPGWGGVITDCIAQQMGDATPANSPGCFSQTIGTPTVLWDVKTSQVSDPVKLVVTGDAANMIIEFRSPGDMLLELCSQGCGADWEACPQAIPCSIDYHDIDKFWSDASYRRKYTRHLGGSNVGFADGHAAWWAMEALESAAPYCECCADETGGTGAYKHTENRPLRGFCPMDSSF